MTYVIEVRECLDNLPANMFELWGQLLSLLPLSQRRNQINLDHYFLIGAFNLLMCIYSFHILGCHLKQFNEEMKTLSPDNPWVLSRGFHFQVTDIWASLTQSLPGRKNGLDICLSCTKCEKATSVYIINGFRNNAMETLSIKSEYNPQYQI